MSSIFNGKTLKKEFVIKDFANHESLLRDFKQMLVTQSSISNVKKVRVYKDKGVRDDLALEYQSLKYNSKDDVNTFFKNNLSLKNYCIALSQIEKYTIGISNFFSQKIFSDWNSEYGKQIMGFELYSFFGSYDMTPFGVHKDHEHTLLVHVGPSVLQVFCWDEELDLNFVNIHDLDSLKSTSRLYTLNPGDLIVIPKWIPHTVQRQEFSITLGAIPYPIKGRWLIERFIKSNLEAQLHKKISFDTHTENDEIGELGITLNKYFNNIQFEIEIKNEVNRLESNGWLINNSLVYSSGDKLEIQNTKNIIYTIEAEKINIFITGRHLILNYAPSIKHLLDELNYNRILTKPQALEILEKDFTNEASELIYKTLL